MPCFPEAGDTWTCRLWCVRPSVHAEQLRVRSSDGHAAECAPNCPSRIARRRRLARGRRDAVHMQDADECRAREYKRRHRSVEPDTDGDRADAKREGTDEQCVRRDGGDVGL